MARPVASTAGIERADRVPERPGAGPVAVPRFAVTFEATRFAIVEEGGGGHPFGIVDRGTGPTRKRPARMNA